MIFKDKYILTNAAVIDGTGSDPQPGMSILINGGIIEAMADSIEELETEGNVQIVDLEGRTVMPGMIDAHIHLFGAAENLDKELMTSDLAMQALRALPQARKVLKYGFTALRDVTYNGLYLKRIFAEGNITGPRIISSGPGLNHMACFAGAANWETLDPIRFKNNWGMGCYGREDMSKAIQILLAEGADQIKVFANGSECGFTDRAFDQHFDLDDLKFIVKQAKKVQGTKVIAHIFDNATAWDCLEAGVDTFEHLGFLDEELCEKMVEKGIYLTPTATLLTLWMDEGMDFSVREGFFYRDLFTEEMGDAARNKCAADFRLAHEKGVKIALGTDTIIDQMTPYGEFSTQELKTMVELGMTPLEAIHSATEIGSEVLGLEDIIGTVEEGKQADLIIVNRDPSEDIDVLCNPLNFDAVIQAGKVVASRGQLVDDRFNLDWNAPAQDADSTEYPSVKDELFPTADEIFSWINDLSSWGHRLTGSPEGRKSAEYIAGKFSEFGLSDVKIEEVPAVFMNCDNYKLEIDGQELECFPGNGTNRQAETGVFDFGAGGETREFVYIGDGSEEEIAEIIKSGIDLKDKIVVSDMRFPEMSPEVMLEMFEGAEVYDPEGKLAKPLRKYNIFSPGTWPFNYLTAAAEGAAGFVGILEDYYDDPYWYNEDYTDMIPMDTDYMEQPALWISRSNGKMLKEKFASQKILTGKMSLRSDYNYRTALNVSGKLPGKSDDIILAHSHHDAVFAGAVQDASGISMMMAMAKYFSQLPEEEREKTMMFAATDTHYAGYVGHDEFIRQRHRNGENVILDICTEHIGKETAFDENMNEYETGEVESRAVYVSKEGGLYEVVKDKFSKYGLDKTLFLQCNVGKGVGVEEYVYSDDEVISDAYSFNEDGIPIVSMVAAEMYIYHISDTPDRIPMDQLEPVGKAFAEIALAAAAGAGTLGAKPAMDAEPEAAEPETVEEAPAKSAGSGKKLSVKSKVSELIADPDAVAVLEKHVPGITSDPRVEMALGMKLKSVVPFSGGLLTKKLIADIDEDLKKL